MRSPTRLLAPTVMTPLQLDGAKSSASDDSLPADTTTIDFGGGLEVGRISERGDDGVVQEVLAPEPVAVDADAAWAALARDKKALGGTPRLVLLEAAGRPRWGVELPATDIREALQRLIV